MLGNIIIKENPYEIILGFFEKDVNNPCPIMGKCDSREYLDKLPLEKENGVFNALCNNSRHKHCKSFIRYKTSKE